MCSSSVYIPGKPQEKNRPLGRYLPPIPSEIATTWIEAQSLQGKLILDPFGASPAVISEAARSGARLIVAANNPITRLIVELSANPPTLEEIRPILATLAAVRIRDERLEPHVSALYQTSCPNCNAAIQAKVYLWEREATTPFTRIIECPHCKASGEFPATEADLQRAAKFKPGGLHHARALERIAPLNDPDRVYVEEALNVYPPRAVYALLTIINKLDTLSLHTRQERILAGLLLSAFDRANTLWPYPVARERPRQLTIPPTYRENNIWLALERATEEWADIAPQVPLSHWPELPPAEGGMCLFEGRIKELAKQLADIGLAAILTAFPRPNQAFWSLSALWAGWLWGHDGVDHFKSVLHRRRYDWAWHTTATQIALKSLVTALPEGLPVLGLVGEAEPGFVAAATMAASLSGLQFEGVALSEKDRQIQFHWHTPSSQLLAADSDVVLAERIVSAARDYLLERGEPSSYLPLYSAIMVDLARQNQFPITDSPAESYAQLQQEIQGTLNYRHGFLRFGGSEKSLEVGQWWLTEASEAKTPLPDRVEMAVVQCLVHHPGCSLNKIKSAIYNEFPGLLTPNSTLIYECIQSYGENAEDGWYIKEQDNPTKRREELAWMGNLIFELGTKLGFTVEVLEADSPQCLWIDASGTPRYAFFVSASALLGKFLVNQDPSPARGVIVLPGGRANLVMFKLQEDARMQGIMEQGWQFVKYRQARQLADSSTLTADSLETQLDLDPLTYSETQLRMF